MIKFSGDFSWYYNDFKKFFFSYEQKYIRNIYAESGAKMIPISIIDRTNGNKLRPKNQSTNLKLNNCVDHINKMRVSNFGLFITNACGQIDGRGDKMIFGHIYFTTIFVFDSSR